MSPASRWGPGPSRLPNLQAERAAGKRCYWALRGGGPRHQHTPGPRRPCSPRPPPPQLSDPTGRAGLRTTLLAWGPDRETHGGLSSRPPSVPCAPSTPPGAVTLRHVLCSFKPQLSREGAAVLDRQPGPAGRGLPGAAPPGPRGTHHLRCLLHVGDTGAMALPLGSVLSSRGGHPLVPSAAPAAPPSSHRVRPQATSILGLTEGPALRPSASPASPLPSPVCCIPSGKQRAASSPRPRDGEVPGPEGTRPQGQRQLFRHWGRGGRGGGWSPAACFGDTQ